VRGGVSGARGDTVPAQKRWVDLVSEASPPAGVLSMQPNPFPGEQTSRFMSFVLNPEQEKI
jgi:hypothetical protein